MVYSVQLNCNRYVPLKCVGSRLNLLRYHIEKDLKYLGSKGSVDLVM